MKIETDLSNSTLRLRRHAPAVAGLLLLACLAARAAENDTVRVTAERMDYLTDEHCMVCEHNVQATIGDGTSLRADKVVAYQGTNAADVEKLVATGNVIIKMPERTVYGQKGTWERATGSVRITGNPVVRQGGHELTADAIRYQIDSGKISFEGQVRAVMQVNDKDKGDLLKF
jgi:lipopolysaccharide transport protein LptA